MERFKKGKAGANTLRVLVATDNHLGFREDCSVRGNDSFDTFEEILKTGRECHVDMCLLGGDLFHVNKPSRNTMTKTMDIFKKYCLGDRDVDLIVRGKFENGNTPNFEDGNLAVDLPVFIIHGNHDDPVREHGTVSPTSPLHLLSHAGLVNYFGVAETIDQVRVEPVLIEKGTAKLKLYGIGWIRDERLNRIFTDNRIEFCVNAQNDQEEEEEEEGGQPKNFPDDETPDRTWLNILMVHQNRDMKGRGSKNCLKESLIPKFMDLVIFGHEHECKIEPEEGPNENTQFCQPGSSVATSLNEAEAQEKHFAIIEIFLEEGSVTPNYELVKIPMRTVRPFVFGDEIFLDKQDGANEGLDPELPEKDKQEIIERILTKRIDELIVQGRELYKERKPNATKSELKKVMPILRQRVEHTGFTPINLQRFGSLYVSKVANPQDMVYFHRRRQASARSSNRGQDAESIHARMVELEQDDELSPQAQINNLVQEVLRKSDKPLKVLSEYEFNDKVLEYVEKNESALMENYLEELIDETIKDYGKSREMDDEMDPREIALRVRDKRNKKARKKQQREEMKKNGASEKAARRKHAKDGEAGEQDIEQQDDDDDDDESESEAETKRDLELFTRGIEEPKGGKTKAKRKPARGRGRKKKQEELESDDEEEEEQEDDDEIEAKPQRKRSKRTAAAAATTKKGKKRKKIVELIDDEVEEDDDDDDDDEEEEEEATPRKRRTGPKSSKSRQGSARSSRSKRRSRVNYNEQDDDDDVIAID